MRTLPGTYFRFVVGAVIATAVLAVLWFFKDIVAYILVSAVLAVVGRPLVRHIVALDIRGRHIPRSVAALMTLVLIWIVAGVFCVLIVPLVFDKIHELVNLDFKAVIAGIQDPVMQLQDTLCELFALSDQNFSLTDSLAATMSDVIDVNSLNRLFSSIARLVFSAVISVLSVSFITFFFLRDEGLFYAMMTSVAPERYRRNVTHMLDSVTVLLSRYFSGLFSESFMLMIAVLLAMMAFGMKASDACFIGLIMAVMNVVPYAGPFVGGVISVFVGIVNPIEGMSAESTALVIVGVLLVLKGLDDFVVQPTLFSERVKAHPLEIFLVILIAASLAGIWGMLLAIPSYTVLRVFAKEFFSQFSLVRKLTDKI